MSSDPKSQALTAAHESIRAMYESADRAAFLGAMNLVVRRLFNELSAKEANELLCEIIASLPEVT